MSAVWPAPAKLNLLLRVTGRRADGYHTLQTVFQFLDLVDALTIEVRRDGVVQRCAGPAHIEPESDLAVRAARRLQAAARVSLGADIRVDKRIPTGGGLGGGSSDAATALVALNRLWRLDWSPDALAALGVTLGADVPVFVHGRAAWAEGIGERLTPLTLIEPWYVIVDPGCPVSTAAVFADPGLTRDSPPLRISHFLAGVGGNDCQAVVCRRHPRVARALAWLDQRAPAQLTGTGGCVFARFDSRQAAQAVLDTVPAGWQGFVVRGVNRSPVLDRLEQAVGDPAAG